MFRHIDNLRAQSVVKRRRVALILSAILSIIIIGLWFSYTQNTESSDEHVGLRAELAPFAILKDALSEFGGKISNVKDESEKIFTFSDTNENDIGSTPVSSVASTTEENLNSGPSIETVFIEDLKKDETATTSSPETVDAVNPL